MKRDVWTALLFLPLFLWPLQATGIRGTVKDELGAVVGQATVIVPTNHVLSTRTDQNGSYSLELPGEGCITSTMRIGQLPHERLAWVRSLSQGAECYF